MKIIKEAGKTKLQITHDEWEKMGKQQGWISSEAKKKKKQKWTDATPYKICAPVKAKSDEKYDSCVEQVKEKHKKD